MSDSTDPPATDSDEELVRLIAQAQQRLYAFVLMLVRVPSDVDDILQETNVVLWRKRHSFQAGTHFIAWATEIARFQVLAYRARRARQDDPFDNALLEELVTAAQQELTIHDQRATALRYCLQKLSPVQRNLITKRYQPGIEVNSLAVELNKTAKAVSESLRRIRDLLRSCIERTLAAENRA